MLESRELNLWNNPNTYTLPIFGIFQGPKNEPKFEEPVPCRKSKWGLDTSKFSGSFSIQLWRARTIVLQQPNIMRIGAFIDNCLSSSFFCQSCTKEKLPPALKRSLKILIPILLTYSLFWASLQFIPEEKKLISISRTLNWRWKKLT